MPSLRINRLNHRRLLKFAKATGRTLSAVAEEALSEWMFVNGEPILKALKRLKKSSAAKKGRLLEFPAGQSNKRRSHKGSQSIAD